MRASARVVRFGRAFRVPNETAVSLKQFPGDLTHLGRQLNLGLPHNNHIFGLDIPSFQRVPIRAAGKQSANDLCHNNSTPVLVIILLLVPLATTARHEIAHTR